MRGRGLSFSTMRPLIHLPLTLILPTLALLLHSGVSSAATFTYSNIPITCKEVAPNTTTIENLTVSVDSTLNGGTITAGTNNVNNCYFRLAGNALSEPYTNGVYNYSSSLDAVCWKTGGFCVTGTSPMTLTISPVSGGQLFTIVASSITTSFTLSSSGGSGGGGGSPVPEPSSFLLVGGGLTFLGLTSRRRFSRQ